MNANNKNTKDASSHARTGFHNWTRDLNQGVWEKSWSK